MAGMVWEYGRGWRPAQVAAISSPSPGATPTQTRKLWEVVEYEGYTNKPVKRDYFATFEEAEHFQRERVSMNKFAGVGGRWTHYWSYPREVETTAGITSRYFVCGARCPSGNHVCNQGELVEDLHPHHFFYCDCTEVGEEN